VRIPGLLLPSRCAILITDDSVSGAVDTYQLVPTVQNALAVAGEPDC
jgi:hypothetical protein